MRVVQHQTHRQLWAKPGVHEAPEAQAGALFHQTGHPAAPQGRERAAEAS